MLSVPCSLPAIKKKKQEDCGGCLYEDSIEGDGCFLFKKFKDCKFKRLKPLKGVPRR